MANVFINSILWFLKLTILSWVGTHDRKRALIRARVLEKTSKINARETSIRHLRVLCYYYQNIAQFCSLFPSSVTMWFNARRNKLRIENVRSMFLHLTTLMLIAMSRHLLTFSCFSNISISKPKLPPSIPDLRVTHLKIWIILQHNFIIAIYLLSIL